MNMSTTFTPMNKSNKSLQAQALNGDNYAQRKQAKRTLQSDRRLARSNKHLAKTL